MTKKLLIILPKCYEKRFAELGDEGSVWSGKVVQFIQNTQDFISQSPFFFPEYTKHTVEHVNRVLEISVKLITVETLQALNADALAVLIMGIISHDIGMFIKPDGLDFLLKKKDGRDKSRQFWKKEWEFYGAKLKHYSDNEIQKYFGNPSNFAMDDGLGLMELPNEISMGKLSQWRIRLCGEFVRRMHPQLAQEIIENGFPGKENVDLFSDVELDCEYRKLIGLVARSHGANIDELDSELKTFDEEAPEYPCELPIYYIMAILRLADYFDAGEDRAPYAYTAIQGLESEVSEAEFKWNQIVKLGNDWGEKRHERVFVQVQLADVDSRTFLKVEEWLKSLQNELDICWRQISLYYKDKYHLSIRRIDSNIFQKVSRKKLEKRIVIEKAQLQAAPQILDLLIAPLYGGEPSYGVRELLQNAIDACKERKILEAARGNDSYVGSVWVEVNATNEQPYFSITDNGCGMDKSVILDYFLVAGNSFRDNSRWKERFEEKNIARNGRFGIGVLAAFLLGSKILVETKPMDEEEAYFFEVNNQNYEQINIGRREQIESTYIEEYKGGTCIQIAITKEIADKMERSFRNGEITYVGVKPDWMQWYWLSSPQVKYIVNGEQWGNPYGCVCEEELCGLQESGRWFQLTETGGYDCLWWTPEKTNKVWCNGIYVPGDAGICMGRYDKCLRFEEDEISDFYLTAPSVAITDSRNVAELSLSRDKLQSIPDEVRKALYIENCKLALALLMMLDFSEHLEGAIEFPFCIRQDTQRIKGLLFSKEGYNLPIRRVLKAIIGQRIWRLYKDGLWEDFPFDKLDGIVSLLQYGDHIDEEDGERDGLFNALFMGWEDELYLETIHIRKKYVNNFCDMSPLQIGRAHV